MTAQTTRLHKLTCNGCGNIMRMSATAAAKGAPLCAPPCGGVYLREGQEPPLPAIVQELEPSILAERINAHMGAPVNRPLAALAAGFLPVASYVLAHMEAQRAPYLYGLVLAALIFSAPTLAAWAKRWCSHWAKAWGFCILLEGVMILSQMQALNVVGLVILVGINSADAWESARIKGNT